MRLYLLPEILSDDRRMTAWIRGSFVSDAADVNLVAQQAMQSTPAIKFFAEALSLLWLQSAEHLSDRRILL